MSIGYRTIEFIQEVEEHADRFGMKIARPRHSSAYDQLSLVPKDENSLPIYTRDAELFIGNLHEAEIWLRGVQWAQQYYQMLGLINEAKIKRKEQNERNRQLMATIKKSGEAA